MMIPRRQIKLDHPFTAFQKILKICELFVFEGFGGDALIHVTNVVNEPVWDWAFFGSNA